jgi:hypothetical protein
MPLLRVICWAIIFLTIKENLYKNRNEQIILTYLSVDGTQGILNAMVV